MPARAGSGALRHLGHAAFFAAVVALAVAGLGLLARELTARGLDAQAQQLLRLHAQADTPWDFHPRRVADLVAGRALGAAEARPSANGIELRSLDGTAYTLGVPLPWPLDLTRHQRVRVDLEADAPVELRWTLRQEANGALLVSTPLLLVAGAAPPLLDLRTSGWQDAATGQSVAAPTRAAELHLRLVHATGTRVRWRGLAWSAEAAAAPDALLQLQGASAEALLAARDHARHAEPARISIVRAPRAPPRLPGGALTRWVLAGAWLLGAGAVLARARRRERAPGRRLLTALICIAPFLAWALLPWGEVRPGGAWKAVFVGVVALILWLGARGYGKSWHWTLHAGVRAWIIPAASVLLVAALLAGSALGTSTGAPNWPAPRHAVMYLLWALLQQLLMLGVIAPRLVPWLPRRSMLAFGLALVFALAHAPNGLLMQGVFLMELVWAWSFLRQRALLPVVVAHAACGLLVAAALPGLPLRSLQVGARFLG